ncbi:subtype I-F CRISPR-associated endonuclease Cas1 [Wohlfahrtiimonas chitiniclastica]|uniref:type I-F CRISPR-associated endonuclease Cas1f n=1 Tax=Wohlfahrtiimonas chitiniclastica TaxID=400946 RepID=UPI00037F37FA|nr:type I-F CRISPR-associated endonuclease Cas1f [Wohlfahrtiimonas chitiniclastica]KZX37798.1 subtype I-F CRISPR-associated endonuclease Cas1 [Wohlfahrtiimonas chitiniclastica]MBS7818839.1 type I-F CRISPR-associated endonuclease Cas1 [Wohlfahrtiimonas chitiniclastica]MBS7820483.1 type I-F CRISPR-associated endonuclease Cas1 [Wohlfahrtiimonas chitiniclastica]MBS7826491.1 type I-F CRISPR-associated endonuclease Cas1 [Wohlfahrtiimonas chitiniclastica]MBS7828799.1 type I-F CRISPR-associated endonu
MDYLHGSDLKAILHSKRANLYYLEHCRVMQKDGRVLYLTEAKKDNQYWNIPIANTTVILLGTGTSITQAAMRMLASAGVLVGFCGGGGTPLFMGTEIEWMTPQSEYRPTEYMQGWMKFWFEDHHRLMAAKDFQRARIAFIRAVWSKDRDLQAEGFHADDLAVEKALEGFESRLPNLSRVGDLLLSEAQMTKQLYKYAAQNLSMTSFTRNPEEGDLANDFLNHGNYLAYGLAASCLWVLGIPHGFAVMHGKTRRGALVFDVADLIKDAVVLPWAFVCAKENMKEQEFRQQVLQKFTEHKCLDYMFNVVKSVALKEWQI